MRTTGRVYRRTEYPKRKINNNTHFSGHPEQNNPQGFLLLISLLELITREKCMRINKNWLQSVLKT